MATILNQSVVTNSQGEQTVTNEGATNLVAGANNNESKDEEIMKDLNETGDKVMPKNEKSIVELRQEAEDAKKAVEENADGLKTKQKARGVIYRKAVKAVKKWFEKQPLPPLRAQFWHNESDEKDAVMITKEEADNHRYFRLQPANTTNSYRHCDRVSDRPVF